MIKHLSLLRATIVSKFLVEVNKDKAYLIYNSSSKEIVVNLKG